MNGRDVTLLGSRIEGVMLTHRKTYIHMYISECILIYNVYGTWCSVPFGCKIICILFAYIKRSYNMARAPVPRPLIRVSLLVYQPAPCSLIYFCEGLLSPSTQLQLHLSVCLHFFLGSKCDWNFNAKVLVRPLPQFLMLLSFSLKFHA